MDKDKIFYRKLRITYMILTLLILVGSCVYLSNISSKATEMVEWTITIKDTHNINFSEDTLNNTLKGDYGRVGNQATYRFSGDKIVITGEVGTKVNLLFEIQGDWVDYMWGGPTILDRSNVNSSYGESVNKVAISELEIDSGQDYICLAYFDCIDSEDTPTREFAHKLQICGVLNNAKDFEVYLVDSYDVTNTLSKHSNNNSTEGYYFLLEKDESHDKYIEIVNMVGDADEIMQDASQGNSAVFYSERSPRVIGPFSETLTDNPFNKFLNSFAEFQKITNILINTAFAFAVITSVIACSISIFKLSTLASHPIKRREAIFEIGSCFICIAILGSIKLVTNLIILTIL